MSSRAVSAAMLLLAWSCQDERPEPETARAAATITASRPPSPPTATTPVRVVPTCSADEVSCDGVCADLGRDRHNCGACGVNCARDQGCQLGVCTVRPEGVPGAEAATSPASLSRCTPGFADCGAGCVDLRDNAAHCGRCGAACAAGGRCVAGVCR